MPKKKASKNAKLDTGHNWRCDCRACRACGDITTQEEPNGDLLVRIPEKVNEAIVSRVITDALNDWTVDRGLAVTWGELRRLGLWAAWWAFVLLIAASLTALVVR